VSEKQEIKSLRALDPETITEVHNRYFPEVYRYVRYRLGDPSTAEDVAGEVFVRLLEALHSGRGPSKSTRGWIFGTASNLVNDSFRRVYKREVEELPEEIEMNDFDPHEITEEREEVDAVRIALTQLTKEQQHVLALRFGSGLSVKETAKIMRKKPNAIKALHFRALNSLRKHMGVGGS
jgi:RNA polymerase sigma-70 factor (ECF subfamily)